MQMCALHLVIGDTDSLLGINDSFVVVTTYNSDLVGC
jgi:hypothetical protein